MIGESGLETDSLCATKPDKDDVDLFDKIDIDLLTEIKIFLELYY